MPLDAILNLMRHFIVSLYLRTLQRLRLCFPRYMHRLLASAQVFLLLVKRRRLAKVASLKQFQNLSVLNLTLVYHFATHKSTAIMQPCQQSYPRWNTMDGCTLPATPIRMSGTRRRAGSSSMMAPSVWQKFHKRLSRTRGSRFFLLVKLQQVTKSLLMKPYTLRQEC